MSAYIGIEHLRWKHSGIPAVVLGSGPSLRFTAGRKSGKRVLIAVNSASMIFPNADYYLSSDGNTARARHWRYVEDGTAHILLHSIPMTFVQGRLGPDRVTLFEKEPGAWALDRFASRLIFGFGSTHCAAHLAVILGCSPIFLIGCDCRFVGGKRHYWQFPGFEPDDIEDAEHAKLSEADWKARTLSHPYGQRYPGDDGSTDNYLWESYNGWAAIKKSSPSVQILDASGGILDRIFPTATIEQALGIKNA